MSKLSIITEPNPILHQKCRKVKIFDDKLKILAQNITETLLSQKGIGLAAPQVGEILRLIVIEYDPKRFAETDNNKQTKKRVNFPIAIPLTILVNPKVTSLSKDTEVNDEGCLSLPGIEKSIKRSIKVNVLAYNLEGERIRLRAKNLFARILQHEIDHLDGILITDKK